MGPLPQCPDRGCVARRRGAGRGKGHVHMLLAELGSEGD